jgi:hypothetical protein
MRYANGKDFGNLEWQARNWGYNTAKTRPTVEDINALLAGTMPGVKFSANQRSELLLSADYAYMMRLKHNATGVEVKA